MDYLELVRRLQSEAGVAGPAIASVLNQTGMSAKLVDWVQESWVEIQNMRPDWEFLRNEWGVNLTINKQDYNVIDDLGLLTVKRFDPNDWRIEEFTTDRSRMTQLDYRRWREKYGPGVMSSGRPSELTFITNTNLRFNAIPDKVYRVTAGGWMTAEELTDNADIPTMPADFHMAIVWKALEHYGFHESAAELITKAQRQWSKVYGQMVHLLTPPVDAGPCPIA